MHNLMPEPGSRIDRVLTFVLANLLWFVFSVLIVTLPAATAGLFATLAPLARGADTEIFSTFFGTMRRQWLKSTVIVGVDALLGVVIAVNFRWLSLMDLHGPAVWFFSSVYISVALMALMVNLYLWPLLVQFDLSLRRLVIVSAKLAFGHAPWTLFTLVLALLPLSLVLIVPPLFSALAAFSTTVLIINWGTWRVIRSYVTPDELLELNHL